MLKNDKKFWKLGSENSYYPIYLPQPTKIRKLFWSFPKEIFQ